MKTLLVLVVLFAGCSTPGGTGDDILAGTADTAFLAADAAEAIFYRLPKMVLWYMPKAILYDIPLSGIRALRGNRAQVAHLMELLSNEETTVEDQVDLSEDLREFTGLPIRSTERWELWWIENQDRPAGEWRQDFVERALLGLTADSYFDRTAAIADLRALFGSEPGYDAKSPRSVQERDAKAWREKVEREGLPTRIRDPLAPPD